MAGLADMRCRAGALVHALVIYSERVMHDRPGQLVPLDAGTLIDVAAAKPARPAPRYSTEALAEAMPEFKVERVRLLGNGMQEYLFKTRGARAPLEAVRMPQILTWLRMRPRGVRHGSERSRETGSRFPEVSLTL
jgi:hypothetical protein